MHDEKSIRGQQSRIEHPRVDFLKPCRGSCQVILSSHVDHHAIMITLDGLTLPCTSPLSRGAPIASHPYQFSNTHWEAASSLDFFL